MLNRVFGDQVNDADGFCLMLAPGARDALFQFGGIPREIAIDDDARVLKV